MTRSRIETLIVRGLSRVIRDLENKHKKSIAVRISRISIYKRERKLPVRRTPKSEVAKVLKIVKEKI